MTREDAIRKIKSMRDPKGRTPEEAKAFREGADRMQAKFEIAESELMPSAFELLFGRARPQYSPEATEAIRKAQAAMAAADMARQQARQHSADDFARKFWEAQRAKNANARKPKRAPRRGDYTGSVQGHQVDPKMIRALMAELGIRTNGDLARMAGVSPSLVSEWMGKGRGNLMYKHDWGYYENKIRKAAK